MLSPASLRVCCLAVMAPALTKADRRADCLPVVLSDPFCESKTVAPYNRKDKYIEANLPKLSSKFACLLNNRRKAYIHKTWFRTHLKNNSPGYCFRSPCPPADLENGTVNAESEKEAWHGTSVTLAVADKVKLKYTMNKNSSQKNMGLARANASHSLQNMKKVNRITQFLPRIKGSPSTPDVGESSPDLPHSTNSFLEMGLTDIIQTCIEEQSDFSISNPEVVSVPKQLSDSEKDVIPPLVTSESEVALSMVCPEENNTLPVPCSDRNVSSPVASAVSDKCSIMSEDVSVTLTSEDISLPVTLTDKDCAVLDSAVESAVVMSNPAITDHFNSSLNLIEKPCLVPSLSFTACLEKSSISPVTFEHSTNNHVNLSISSDENTSVRPSSVSSCFENLNFHSNDFIACSSLQPVETKHSDKHSIAPSTSEVVEPRVLRKKVPKKRDCCKSPVDSKALLDESFNERLNKIMAAVEKTELLARLCISAYSKKEISELVKTYQHKLNIPCQKQTKRSSRSNRDIIDIKTELLKNEEVKRMSTAALVNLVQTIESSGSPGNLLPNQPLLSSGIDASSTEAVPAFATEDVADVIHTSSELLNSIKKELKYVDPDLTESSDSECELDTPESDSVHKMALLKFMKERASLTCRSTWLIARIHELENQLRTANGALLKITSLGDISFEEELATSKSAAGVLSTASSDEASTETASKIVKGLTGPVNGYLESNHLNSIAHIGLKTCSVETLLLDKNKHKNSSSESFENCSRTRALNVSAFQKRDVVVTTGLHFTNNKLAKLSSIGCHCSCKDEVLPCVLCMGRYQCVQSIDPSTTPLLDRVSLLDSNFHPLLSYQKDVPLVLHFESILKKNESQYQIERPVSPTPNFINYDLGTKPKTISRSRRLQRYAFSRSLSAKYRNNHLRTSHSKHLRKHGLVFGIRRKYQAQRSLQTRDRMRRISIDSSSSHESPVLSPSSIYEESYDSVKRRRDENQFDIDDVIIPYSNKSARLVDFEFKDIVVPSFRIDGNEALNSLFADSSEGSKDLISREESVHEETYITRHDPLEIDEKKINRRPSVLNIQPNPKRARRDHRVDSRADSSGANTPDPVLFSDQDMFQDQNSMTAPTPPALSPPATPLSSNNPLSDDSQPSFSGSLVARLERKKVPPQKRLSEENTKPEEEVVLPYELRTFPLSNEQYEEITMDPYGEDFELTVSGPSSPASAGSTTMSTSTIEDITDPEWMVLRNNAAPEPGLKLKLAKR